MADSDPVTHPEYTALREDLREQVEDLLTELKDVGMRKWALETALEWALADVSAEQVIEVARKFRRFVESPDSPGGF